MRLSHTDARHGMGAPASCAHKDNQVARGVNDVRDPADISNKTVMGVEHSLLCCVALVRLSVQLLVRGKTQRARVLGTVVCVALPQLRMASAETSPR